MEAESGSEEPYLAALRRCQAKLSAADEQLLQLRYVEQLGVGEIAGRLQRLQPSVSRSLAHIRHWLLESCQMELAGRNAWARAADGRRSDFAPIVCWTWRK